MGDVREVWDRLTWPLLGDVPPGVIHICNPVRRGQWFMSRAGACTGVAGGLVAIETRLGKF